MNFRRDSHFAPLIHTHDRGTPFMNFQPKQKAEPIKRKAKVRQPRRFSFTLALFYALVLFILFSLRGYFEQYGHLFMEFFK